MKQYHSVGRDKLDGYSIADFAGMTEDELQQAESMLIASAEELDTTAFRGLALLKTNNGKVTLERIISQLEPPSLAHLRAVESLYEITQDDRLQWEISRNLDKKEPFLYERAIIAMARMRPTSFLFEMMKAAFLDTMDLREQESVVRSEACEAIMGCFGFPPFVEDRTPERLALERKLYSSELDQFDQVLDDVRTLGRKRGYSFSLTD
jgi:hypothetical protein